MDGQGVSLNFFGEAPKAVRGWNAEKVQDAPPLADAPSVPLAQLEILEMSLEEAEPLDAWLKAPISEHHDLTLCERRSFGALPPPADAKRSRRRVI
jgi:hypothetical protein